MQTISTFVVQYRNLLAKSKNAAAPILADMIITRCPVQDQLWISVVQLNRGRKELVYVRFIRYTQFYSHWHAGAHPLRH